MTDEEMKEECEKITEEEQGKYQKLNRFQRRRLIGSKAFREAIKKLSSKGYRIKGMLAESAGLIVIYGPPGSCKSFVALDMALCISSALPFHGRETKQGKVLYIAGEGQDGILRRYEGWRLEHPEADLENFQALPLPVRLDTSDLNELLVSIRDLPDEKPDVIIIDTLARSMTGDENSTKDMGEIVRALDQIHEETGAQVIVIHHTGKDETRGMRGAIALTGAVDVTFQTAYNGTTLTLLNKRQKDEELLSPMKFKTIVVNTGIINSDGEELNTLILDFDEDATEKAAQNPETAGKKGQAGKKGLTGQKKRGLDAFMIAIQEKGEIPTDKVREEMVRSGGLVLPSDKVLHEDAWREECYQRLIPEPDPTPDAQRKAYKRVKEGLLNECLETFKGYYWLKK